MKTVAGMVADSKKPAGIKYSTRMKNRNLPEDIGVIGGNFRTSKREAVLANAILAYASELEDDRRLS